MKNNQTDVNQARAEEIFRVFVENNRDKLLKIDQGHSEIDGLIQDTKEKVFNWVKKKCQDSFRWIEQHGDIHYSDKGVHVNIKENYMKEADVKLHEFSECTKNNDFDIGHYFNKTKSQVNEIASLNENCVFKCFDSPTDKSDDEMKGCLDKCYNITFKQMDNFFDGVKRNVREVENKMI